MTNELTMGNLSDGIGGFPLATVRNDIRPVWASEIEAFPIAVTKLRFPVMIHVGDIAVNFVQIRNRYFVEVGKRK